jgi:predicted SnoaL-like aldol condensation-catalyzing enzyme
MELFPRSWSCWPVYAPRSKLPRGRCEAGRSALETKDQTALDVISSKQFVQHNAGIEDGREGLTAFLNRAPGGVTVRIIRIFADEDYVVAQSEYNLSGSKVAFDGFRFEGSQIVEHWDNVHDECAVPNVGGRTQLDGPTWWSIWTKPKRTKP